jgi:hypothetical protein
MKPETLHDRLYRASFQPATVPGWRENGAMRRALESAHRFVVDEPMARFMAELANESFLIQRPIIKQIADSLRVQARVPHEAIWLEYPLRAYQERSCELRGTMATNEPWAQPEREGWLIHQHPKIDTACIMHLFTSHEHVQEDGFNTWTFPFAFAWCCDDSPLPWRKVLHRHPQAEKYAEPSSYLVGISGYERDNVCAVRSPLINDPNPSDDVQLRYLLTEWSGIVRRVWALLATIDNLPITKGDVRQSRGFLARGRIRKYLSHRTITLNVPAKKDTRVLARRMIAAAHRKRHRVRGHWRDDWRNPPSKNCNPHLWEAVDDEANHIRCALCHGRQTYIAKHERGDAALGWVDHDYRVTHDPL